MTKDIGILALEIYFPKKFISQNVLEVENNVIGKYTEGLGQQAMGICDVAEDVNSLALTVTQNLINRVGLDLKTVGFLEVGSETLVDKSKSTKSVLMQLFEASGNYDVAGVDVKSACYGSTAALFNAINWLESSSCNSRLAIVVASDIAVYGEKNAQPTGGAGAVAILLGPNAHLVIDPGLRVNFMRHRYDFYKPLMRSVFPQVDGHLSISCYKEAVQSCYRLYQEKVKQLTGEKATLLSQTGNCSPDEFPIDFACFHSPFCKLVAKSFGWLTLQDVKAVVMQQESVTTKTNMGDMINGIGEVDSIVSQLSGIISEAESSAVSREVDTLCMKATKTMFENKVAPGLQVASQIGNIYTASLYSSLISLCSQVPKERLRGSRVMMFAYGSGYTASIFSLRVSETADFAYLLGETNVIDRLAQRSPITYQEFLRAVDQYEANVDKAPLKPDFRAENFFPNSYYLSRIDEKYRRFYERVPPK